MAKGTDERTQSDLGVPGQLPPQRHRSAWLPWTGLVAFIIVGSVAVLIYANVSRPTQHHVVIPPPASVAPTAGPAGSIPPAVPATTLEAFAALSPQQKDVVMQQVLQRYATVLEEAYSNLDPALLSEVATGDELQTQTTTLQGLIDKHQPQSSSIQFTIIGIAAPAPLAFVSVDTRSTETDVPLSPTTLQPVGSAATVVPTHSSFTMVIQGGTWKVRDQIEEQP
jgi:hypothetical protein